MNNDASLEATVAPGSCAVPHVHSHARTLSIGRSRKVGVVKTGTILRIQIHEVIAYAALTVVVGLEVAGFFSKTQLVKEVMIGVRGIEKLSDRGIDVALPFRIARAVWIPEAEVFAVWAGLVERVILVIPVALGNTIVAPCGGIVLGAVTVPTEFTTHTVEGIGDDDTRTFSGIVKSPGAGKVSYALRDREDDDLLDFIGGIRTVVDYMVDLFTVLRIDVGQEPIATHICLHPPAKH